MGNPPQSYGASPAIWDHTELAATRHRWTCSTLTPARQAGTRFTYSKGMEGWVYLVLDGLAVHKLIVTRPEVKPYHYTTKSLCDCMSVQHTERNTTVNSEQ